MRWALDVVKQGPRKSSVGVNALSGVVPADLLIVRSAIGGTVRALTAKVNGLKLFKDACTFFHIFRGCVCVCVCRMRFVVVVEVNDMCVSLLIIHLTLTAS